MLKRRDAALFHCYFFFSSRRRHTRCLSDWSSDVCSSDLHIYAQVIDDTQGVTLVSATSVKKVSKGENRPTGGNVGSAKDVGKLIAERAKQKGIEKVVFDRGAHRYPDQ